jgi:GTP-binding protein
MSILILEPFFDGASAQDKRIGAMIKESGKACLIAVNKTDLCDKTRKKELSVRLRATMPFLNYAPLVFISALKGIGIHELMSVIVSVSRARMDKPPTPIVNRIIEDAQGVNPPPNHFKVYYSTFIGGPPPTFLIFCNKPSLCPQHYLSYIENSLRKKFAFLGYPLHIQLRARKNNENSKSQSGR